MDMKDISRATATLAFRGLVYSLGVGAVLIAGAQTSFTLHIKTDEGLVEWLQFVVLLGGAVALAMRANPQGRWWRYLVVAALFVLAMEEIDWAQPYLGYTPWSLFAKNNIYGEMALHNAFGMETYLRKLVLLGIMAGGAGLLIVIGLKRRLEGVLDYIQTMLLVPGALLAGAVMVFVAGRVLHPGSFFGFDEFGELSGYAGMVLFILSRPLEGLRSPP